MLTFTIKEKENIFNDIPRIIYREGNCRYFGMVHEEIRCNQGNLILIMLNTIIYHDGYNEVVLNHKKKILRNLYLLKQMMNEEKENLRWVYFYIRDGKYIFSDKYIINCIKQNILVNKDKELCASNLKKESYVFEILLLYFEILQSKRDMKSIMTITENLLEEFPNNYDLIYFNVLSKLQSLKIQTNLLLKEVIELKQSHLSYQNSYIDKKGYHIDLLIAILLFENMQYGLSKKYFEFVENKLNGKMDLGGVKNYIDLLRQID